MEYSCYSVNASGDSVNESAWSYVGFPNPEQHRVNGVVMATLFSLLLPVGAVLNFLVIVIICRDKLYTQPTLILLLNLSVTDLLLCLLVMPFHIITGFAGEFVFGSSDLVRCRVCKTGVILIVLTSQSLFSLSFISVDRLLFIKKPLQYHKLIVLKHIAPVLVVLWVISVAIALPPLFNVGEYNYSRAVSHCVLDIHVNMSYTIFLVIVAVIPLLLLLFCTIWVACIARKHLKSLYSTRLSFTSASDEQEFKKGVYKQAKRKKSQLQFHLVRVFGAIITGNIITWLPMLAWICAAAVEPNKDNIPLPFRSFAFICFLVQPVLHPVLEACLISDIKAPLIKLIVGVVSCRRCKNCRSRQHGVIVSPISPIRSPTTIVESPISPMESSSSTLKSPTERHTSSEGDGEGRRESPSERPTSPGGRRESPSERPTSPGGRRGIQCDCGVVVCGVMVGRVGGEWACSVCGLLDMCSVVVLDSQPAHTSHDSSQPTDMPLDSSERPHNSSQLVNASEPRALTGTNTEA